MVFVSWARLGVLLLGVLYVLCFFLDGVLVLFAFFFTNDLVFFCYLISKFGICLMCGLMFSFFEIYLKHFFLPESALADRVHFFRH